MYGPVAAGAATRAAARCFGIEAVLEGVRCGYARGSQVLNLDVGPGVVTSRVQGSRATPCKVKIAVKTLTTAKSSKVVEALAEQAIFAAKLLAGEMSKDVETAFWAAHRSLFPTQRADLQTDCSCPDHANPY